MSSSSSREPLAALFPAAESRVRASGASVRRRAATDDLATVAPRDEGTEHDRKRAEAGGEERGGPRNRREHRDTAERHEADPHDRNGANGEHAAGHDARAVQEKPARRKQRVQAETREVEGEHDADGNWRSKAQGELSERGEDEGLARAPPLPDAGCDPDHN